MIWMAKYHFKEVDIMMLILLIILLIGYLVLLITRYKKKNNFKINGNQSPDNSGNYLDFDYHRQLDNQSCSS